MFNHQLILYRRRKNKQKFQQANFLHKEAVEEITFRTSLVAAKFNNVLELGYRDNLLKQTLAQKVEYNNYFFYEEFEDIEEVVRQTKFDLIISNLSFHYLNNFPLMMGKLRHLLSEKGVLIFSIFGNDTLLNIKTDLAMLEAEYTGKAYQRVMPMIRSKDLTPILQHAGFKEIIIDCDTRQVEYKNFRDLAVDLKSMSENNSQKGHIKCLNKKLYKALLTKFSHAKFLVDFDIIYVTAT